MTCYLIVLRNDRLLGTLACGLLIVERRCIIDITAVEHRLSTMIATAQAIVVGNDEVIDEEKG